MSVREILRLLQPISRLRCFRVNRSRETNQTWLVLSMTFRNCHLNDRGRIASAAFDKGLTLHQTTAFRCFVESTAPALGDVHESWIALIGLTTSTERDSIFFATLPSSPPISIATHFESPATSVVKPDEIGWTSSDHHHPRRKSFGGPMVQAILENEVLDKASVGHFESGKQIDCRVERLVDK